MTSTLYSTRVKLFVKRFVPPQIVKRLGQIHLLGRILRRLPFLSRRRGFWNIAQVAWRFRRDGSGSARFAQWCLETLGYEERDDPTAYRNWIANVEATLQDDREFGASRASDELRCTVVSVSIDDLAEQVLAVAEPYVLFTHGDAVLSPQAIPRLLSIAVQTDADLVYSDEDEIQNGERSHPYFKPDFSIDLARSEDYIGPVYLLRTSVAQRVLRDMAEAAPLVAYTLPLTLYENNLRIEHAAEVLVHWKARRDRSLSSNHLRFRNAHLKRCYGPDLGQVLAGGYGGDPGRVTSTDTPLVSIIIPTRDRIDLLATCLDSIYRSKPAVPFEVVVLDNRSEEAESRSWFAQARQQYGNLEIISADYEFNWSRLNNQGIAASRGRVLLFLNNDIEVISANWLDRLVAQALRPDVGAVGALLLYPDGTVQHAGVVMGIGGFADHIYSGAPLNMRDRHVFAHPGRSRNVSVCTGACLAIERSKLERVSGFDEALKICGDVAVCVRLLAEGLLVVYDADVQLTHYESATRSRAALPSEEIKVAMQVCAAQIERGDVFYNRNLSLLTRYPTLED